MANSAKFAWLHSLRMCCLSGRADIEISHLHEGMFQSSNKKVSDVLVLPMAAALHRAQHAHPAHFWRNALPGQNPKAWAIRLDDIWTDRDLEGAELLFRDMQDLARRDYLAQFLIA